jgi:hypothetical protein
MGLTMSQKQAVTKQMSEEYNKATKKGAGEILDSLIDFTGYIHCYASRVFRNRSKPKALGRTRRGNHILATR